MNIYIKRSNQATIAAMCRYRATCAVRRNGTWENESRPRPGEAMPRHEMDTEELVPGKLITFTM